MVQKPEDDSELKPGQWLAAGWHRVAALVGGHPFWFWGGVGAMDVAAGQRSEADGPAQRSNGRCSRGYNCRAIFLNYLPYRSAQLFPVRSTSMEQFFSQAQRSFQTFPPLATLERQVLFNALDKHWERVKESGEAVLLHEVRAEGQAALKSEPHNARLHLALARVYQRAGATDPAYLPVARRHVEEAQELAPGIIEALRASISQEIAEEDYVKALTMIYAYTGKSSNMKRGLSPMLGQAEQGLIAQIGRDEFRCRWGGKEDLTREEREQIEC